MKPQFEFHLQIELPNRQIKPHRRIAISLWRQERRGGGFQTSPSGSELTRRLMRYPPGFPIPAGYGETGGQKPAQYRLGKPARPFATRPDFSNPAGYGRAEIHSCPPLVWNIGKLTVLCEGSWDLIIGSKKENLWSGGIASLQGHYISAPKKILDMVSRFNNIVVSVMPSTHFLLFRKYCFHPKLTKYQGCQI